WRCKGVACRPGDSVILERYCCGTLLMLSAKLRCPFSSTHSYSWARAGAAKTRRAASRTSAFMTPPHFRPKNTAPPGDLEGLRDVRQMRHFVKVRRSGISGTKGPRELEARSTHEAPVSCSASG